MAALSIRDLDDDVVERLRVHAAHNGRSMESEARAIIARAVETDGDQGLFATILDRFGAAGGLDLDPPDRDTPSRAADLSA